MNNKDETTTLAMKMINFCFLFHQGFRQQYRNQNDVKVNSHACLALIVLKYAEQTSQSITMSQLADELQITKQQLTKLVNDLEERRFVSRIHDTQNRRLVHIRLTPEGYQQIQNLLDDMTASTITALNAYTDEEKAELDNSLEILARFFTKFSIKL